MITGMAATCRNPRRLGFTLVELLVVIGILVVLVSLLVPTLGRVRETAREAQCRGNLRQLMTGFIAFAADHERTLPGGYYDIGNADPTRRCWLMGGDPNWRNAPQTGTLFPYIKNMSGGQIDRMADRQDMQQYIQVYRCPSLTDAPGSGARGKTSNGRFDYSMFLSFAGARLDNVRQTARYRRPDGQFTYLPTPVLCEENTEHLNTLYTEGGHASSDQLGHQHRGGAHYASIDGSVHWFVEDRTADTRSWSSQAPSGNWVELGADKPWGWWNHQ
jgi:prepilin-type N-terminal cleavage/methylation domain-containing protein